MKSRTYVIALLVGGVFSGLLMSFNGCCREKTIIVETPRGGSIEISSDNRRGDHGRRHDNRRRHESRRWFSMGW